MTNGDYPWTRRISNASLMLALAATVVAFGGMTLARYDLIGKMPGFFSLAFGALLAAAAAIEAVYSVLALQNNVVFPNLNFKNQMEEFNITPQTTLKEKEINHVLSNSFGFGGNCSTVIFSKN